MRLLILNPNTTDDVTKMVADAAVGNGAPDTEIDTITAPWGLPYIATRADATVAGHVILEMLAEHHRHYDAAVIAAFGDPGLGGARELFDIAIIGMSEAAMLTACMTGRRFSVITFSPVLRPWYAECVAWHGLNERCASIRALDESFSSVSAVQDEKEELLLALARRAIEEDGADVVIPAGTPLAGLARRIKHLIDVPVVDLVASAVRQAEVMAALSHRAPVSGTFQRPPAKESTGLAGALAARFARTDE